MLGRELKNKLVRSCSKGTKLARIAVRLGIEIITFKKKKEGVL